MWTSLEIGIKFDKPTNIRAQLDKIANGGKPKPSSKPTDFSNPTRKSSLAREPFSPSAATGSPTPQPEDIQPEEPLEPTARFAALKSFYKTQLSVSNAGADPASTLPSAADISSPSSLARIVNLYTNLGATKKPKSRTPVIREALTPAEGLLLPPSHTSTTPTATHNSMITHLNESASLAQKSFQQSAAGCGMPHAKLVSDLRPMPALLRTKRAKRCAACKHILVKPEFKPTGTRYRIKLTALNYIPLVNLKPIAPAPSAKTPAEVGEMGQLALQPHRPYQWVLTLKNHLFDTVKVSLATPAATPGRLRHRVTVLCPQFEVGANSDVWDDALGGDKRGSIVGDGPRLKGEFGVAEAGKVHDKGRNWTSVVLEVVPVDAVREGTVGFINENKGTEAPGPVSGAEKRHMQMGEEGDEGNVDDDDNVVEIPIRVRLEWRQSDIDDGGEGQKKTNNTATTSTKVNEDGEVEDTAKRELAYWMVLGVGSVGSLVN
jgi:dynactin-4